MGYKDRMMMSNLMVHHRESYLVQNLELRYIYMV